MLPKTCICLLNITRQRVAASRPDPGRINRLICEKNQLPINQLPYSPAQVPYPPANQLICESPIINCQSISGTSSIFGPGFSRRLLPPYNSHPKKPPLHSERLLPGLPISYRNPTPATVPCRASRPTAETRPPACCTRRARSSARPDPRRPVRTAIGGY